MKTKRFKNEDLRNEEWFQFYTEFKTLVEQYTPAALNIDELFAVFLVLYSNSDEALEIIRKNAATGQLAEADTTRDIDFRGFAEAVKSALHHFDAAKREAARRLQITFDHYGNLARKPYDEETASIYNFVQEMNGKHASDIAVLGLNDWVIQLDADNKAFEALLKTRYAEDAGKTDLRMKDVRRETDRNYRDILDRIDALILINGDSAYAPFVKELNIRVERYSDIIAQRKGRSAKRKGKEQ
jgi:hypothetical protein